jgi:predicted  nucleic acid-binding Zn-ribbon protein
MRHPSVENLLILQARDTTRLSLEAENKLIPGGIEAVEKKILAEKTAIEDARAEMKSLEAQKKVIETEIGSAQGTLAKYKTQQSLVRKNDEYQALGQQIETAEAGIGALEETQLGVMFAIDEAKLKFDAAEKVLKDNIAGHEARIGMFREREKTLAEELAGARAEVAAAREPLDELTLRLYDRIAANAQPVIAAARGANCGGCHLKLSGENEAVARKGEALAICDQCGRIIYRE